MSRKRVTIKKETHIEPELEEEDDDPFEKAKRDFSDLGEKQARLEVYTYDREEGQKYVKGFGFDPELHTLDWIRSKWGPGSYQLRFKSPGKYWTKVVTLADETARLKSAAAGAPASSSLGVEKLVEILVGMNQTLLTGLLQRQAAAPSENPMGPVIAAMIQGNQELTKTLLLSSLQKPDITGSLMTALERFTEFASGLQVDADGGILSTVRALAKDLGPVLKDALSSNMRRPMLPAAGGSPPVNGGVAGPTGFATTNAPFASPAVAMPAGAMMEPQMMIQTVLVAYLPLVKEAAQRGEKPEELAEEILAQIPPIHYELLDSLTADQVLALDGTLGPYKGYIDAVIEHLHRREFPAAP